LLPLRGASIAHKRAAVQRATAMAAMRASRGQGVDQWVRQSGMAPFRRGHVGKTRQRNRRIRDGIPPRRGPHSSYQEAAETHMDELRHGAYHEAGHAVIGFLLGADLRTLELRRKDDGSMPCDIQEAPEESKALILAAGRAAELLFFHEALPGIGAGDYTKVCSMRLSMSSAEGTAFENRINQMVSDHAIAIMLLAEELLACGSKKPHEAHRTILATMPRDLEEQTQVEAMSHPNVLADYLERIFPD
jgi:hypothetical protein